MEITKMEINDGTIFFLKKKIYVIMKTKEQYDFYWEILNAIMIIFF
jgi:hypothetical protein